MKIVILLSCLEVGGAEIQAFNFARYIKELDSKDNIEVEVVGITSKGKLTNMLDSESISWKFIPFSVKPSFLGFIIESFKFVLEFRKQKGDVLISYTLIPNVLGGLIWKLLGYKMFIWGQRDAGHDICNLRVLNLAVKNTNHFISNSKIGAEYLIKSLGVKKDKVKIVRNSYYPNNENLESNDYQSLYTLKNYNFVANMVGNLSQVKDHITLLEAWKIFLQKVKNSKVDIKPILLIAGRFDATYEKIENYIKENNLTDSVKLLGGINDVLNLHKNSNAFLYSTFSEGSPNVIIEAMMSKLPIIATDIQPIRDIFPEENLKFLTKPKDPEDFADKIFDLAKLSVNLHRLNEIGLINYNYASKMFDAKTNLKQIYDYIKKSINEK